MQNTVRHTKGRAQNKTVFSGFLWCKYPDMCWYINITQTYNSCFIFSGYGITSEKAGVSWCTDSFPTAFEFLFFSIGVSVIILSTVQVNNYFWNLYKSSSQGTVPPALLAPGVMPLSTYDIVAYLVATEAVFSLSVQYFTVATFCHLARNLFHLFLLSLCLIKTMMLVFKVNPNKLDV